MSASPIIVNGIKAVDSMFNQALAAAVEREEMTARIRQLAACTGATEEDVTLAIDAAASHGCLDDLYWQFAIGKCAMSFAWHETWPRPTDRQSMTRLLRGKTRRSRQARGKRARCSARAQMRMIRHKGRSGRIERGDGHTWQASAVGNALTGAEG